MTLFKMDFTVTKAEAAEIGKRLLNGQLPDHVDRSDAASIMGSAITMAVASSIGPNHGNFSASYQSDAATEYLQEQSRE